MLKGETHKSRVCFMKSTKARSLAWCKVSAIGLRRLGLVLTRLGFMLELHFPDVTTKQNFDRCGEWDGE
jgi:hypothetical protein